MFFFGWGFGEKIWIGSCCEDIVCGVVGVEIKGFGFRVCV